MHEPMLIENQNHLYAAYFSAVGLRHSETWEVARVKILRKDLLQPSKTSANLDAPLCCVCPTQGLVPLERHSL